MSAGLGTQEDDSSAWVRRCVPAIDRAKIPKLTCQPGRGILRAMDRGAVGVPASGLQQVAAGGLRFLGAATIDRISN